MYSRAYGCDELQPGSSRKRAWTFGMIHSANSIVWWSLLIASPGSRSIASIACETEVSNGASVAVVWPGAGKPHAHDTRPEQSERYGSHAALSGRVQVEKHTATTTTKKNDNKQNNNNTTTHTRTHTTALGSPSGVIIMPASGPAGSG